MSFLSLMPLYAKWHYTLGFQDLFHNWKNLISFSLHLFSLRFLFKTWFAPFGRLNEEYKKGFDPEVFFETLAVNTVMRAVGFVLRTFVMAAGLFVFLLFIVLGPVVFFLWTLAPFIILSLLFFGAANILS